jgi:Kdo2-lipid IVA lauroyltransferase/acyltransferase
VKRSAFRNWTEYLLAAGVVKSLEWAPLPLAYVLARGWCAVLDRALPRLRGVALRNLSLAMPELEKSARGRIVDGVFRSIARLLVAFARFPSIDRSNLDRWIRLEGGEHFENALRAGRGVLFATAHLGNWELSAFAHALIEGPMHIVVRPLDNPLIDRLVERRRTLTGNHLIEKEDFARGILKALAANQAVGILIDQNASPADGVFVNFFGLRACASTGFAKLAAHSGAAVIPGFALWSDEEQRYILHFDAPIPISGDAARDTQTLQAVLEATIRKYPDQWLWIHRRWKTRPAGEAELYES